LSRQLNRADLWWSITARVLQLVRGKIGQSTLLVVDISDISKSYAKKMEYLGGVYDRSKGGRRDHPFYQARLRRVISPTGLWVGPGQLEDVRVLTCTRLQKMMALAVACFTMVYLARRLKLKAISSLALKVSRRIFGIPDFRYYALSDGIRELLKRSDQGPLRSLSHKTPQYQFFLFNP
jgi:hypothetical protein